MNQFSNLTYSDVVFNYNNEPDSWNSLRDRLTTLNNQLNSSRSYGRRWNIRQEISSIEHKIRNFFPVRLIIPARVAIEGNIDHYEHKTGCRWRVKFIRPQPQGLFGFSRTQTIIGGIVILGLTAAVGYLIWRRWGSPSSTSQSNLDNSGGGSDGTTASVVGAAAAKKIAEAAAKAAADAAAKAAAEALAAARKQAAHDLIKGIDKVYVDMYLFKVPLESL